MLKPVLYVEKEGRWMPAPPTQHNIYLESVSKGLCYSFASGAIRNALEGAFFKVAEVDKKIASVDGSEYAICGKCFYISHNSWTDYERILRAWKTLSYKLRKMNPEVNYLWLQDPEKSSSVLVDLKSNKRFCLNLV